MRYSVLAAAGALAFVLGSAGAAAAGDYGVSLHFGGYGPSLHFGHYQGHGYGRGNHGDQRDLRRYGKHRRHGKQHYTRGHDSPRGYGRHHNDRGPRHYSQGYGGYGYRGDRDHGRRHSSRCR